MLSADADADDAEDGKDTGAKAWALPLRVATAARPAMIVLFIVAHFKMMSGE
jgi:hypothetical protein